MTLLQEWKPSFREEFNKLNVLQQKAYAEAVGMSADELANTLKTQELLKQTGDNSLEALNERRRIAAEEGKSEEFLQELRRAGTSEEMIANQSQLASQDKLNALVEKTLELFSTMVEPMTHLVGKAIDFVDALGGAKVLLGIIGGLWVGKIAVSIATTGVQLALQTAQSTNLSTSRCKSLVSVSSNLFLIQLSGVL